MSTVPGHGILTHVPNIGFNPCVPSPNVFSENHVPTAKERCQDYGLQSATHNGSVTRYSTDQVLRVGGVLYQPDRCSARTRTKDYSDDGVRYSMFSLLLYILTLLL